MVRRCHSSRLTFETLEARQLLAFDPSPLEQELLLLVNRMRTSPQAELGLLVDRLTPIHSPDPDINSSLQFFDVDGAALQSQWNSLTPVQPLAWNEALYNGAHGHNTAMIAAQQQSHQVPGEASLGTRLTAAGYNWNAIAENIYAFAESPLYAHAGFAIDWGFTSTGMQTPPGHRINIMNGTYREAGIAINSATSGSLGPLVVTQDFGNRFNFGNAFVLGAIWNDTNDSGWYNAGEGLGGVSIEFTKAGSAPIVVTSMSAGGYQTQLAPGTYAARAFGGGLPFDLLATNIVVGGSNVMLNFVKPDGLPPIAEEDRAGTIRNAAIAIDVRGNDTEAGGAATSANIEIVSTIAGSQVAVNQVLGLVTFTPPVNFVGGATFSYRLRNVEGFVSSAVTVTIAVADPATSRHNPLRALDVDFDGFVTPADAALVIAALNAGVIGQLPALTPGQSAVPFWDTTGDNSLDPLDALEIFNYLNAGGSAEAVPDDVAEQTAIDTVLASTEMGSPMADIDFSPWAWYWMAIETHRRPVADRTTHRPSSS